MPTTTEASTDAPTDATPQKPGRSDRRGVCATAALFAAGFIAYGFNNVFMTVTPSFVQSIGGSLALAGAQGTVFLFAAVALRFYLGPLADRIGTRPVMALGVAAFAVSAPLFCACTAFWQVLALRCLQAVGIAAFFPCATATVSATAPSQSAGRRLGIYRLVTSASLLCGPSVAFALVDAAGYRACFAVMGVLALLSLALVLALPRSLGTFRQTNRQLATDASNRRLSTVAALRACCASDPRLCALIMGPTLLAALGYGLLYSFGATYVASVDAAVNSGLLFTLIGLGGLIANPLAGLAADRCRSRTALLAGWLACFGAGICTLGAFGMCGPAALVVAGVLAGAGYAGTITTVLAIAAARVDTDLRASMLALQQNGIDLGIGCASGLFGLVFEALSSVGTSGSAVFGAWGALTALAAALLALAHRGSARHAQRHTAD